MHEHGGREGLLSLARQYDGAIAQRLEQLFETRAAVAIRPDLISVAQSLADQIVASAKSVPVREFVRSLPFAASHVRPSLEVSVDDGVRIRNEFEAKNVGVDVPIVVRPVALVPKKLEVTLFPEDDATFSDGTRRRELTGKPLYFAADFSVRVRFGPSWFQQRESRLRDAVRLRVSALDVTGDIVSADTVCTVRSPSRKFSSERQLDTTTLVELYPGVNNTPAIDEAFIGRMDELEQLYRVIINSSRPSPVLLTGMRRIGKTSLLFAFHKNYKEPNSNSPLTIYFSLAERKVELETTDKTVSHTIFRAISHALIRPNLNITDQNYLLHSRIRLTFGGDWKKARKEIEESYDNESLSDSLISLGQRVNSWTGAPNSRRVVFLIDEAEALVAPYLLGGAKRTELEQFLQSIREVSQSTDTIGVLLAGSNHISVFSREYKNAFFGSSQVIQLEGLKKLSAAKQILCPNGLLPFVQFEENAIELAHTLCAGVPQFLWQVGATTSHIVRSGVATRVDVRNAVAMLVGEGRAGLPFKAYDVLEPIESMLQLHTLRERDLLWLLLYRVAASTSLVAERATMLAIIDQILLGIDDRAAWSRRLISLAELRILDIKDNAYCFAIQLFGEGFRTKRIVQEYEFRLMRVSE